MNLNSLLVSLIGILLRYALFDDNLTKPALDIFKWKVCVFKGLLIKGESVFHFMVSFLWLSKEKQYSYKF